jgi:hypothetical protein
MYTAAISLFAKNTVKSVHCLAGTHSIAASTEIMIKVVEPNPVTGLTGYRIRYPASRDIRYMAF